MEHPVVTTVVEGSPADRGRASWRATASSRSTAPSPTDVIEYQQLTDGRRRRARGPSPPTGHERERARSTRATGEPLGLFVASAVFDRVRTCDNHCPFCFIYQLPKGMRRSLYVKDDDYRLSFLYGNFTTLTRFTELDVERVLTERLGPLYVSIHTTDPELRAEMLRNPRGATSPALARGAARRRASRSTARSCCARASTTARRSSARCSTCSTSYEALASLGVVPLGLSDYSTEPDAARRTPSAEAADGDRPRRGVPGALRRAPSVVAACTPSDELYLVAGRALPGVDGYDSLDQAENGIGLWAGVRRRRSRAAPRGALGAAGVLPGRRGRARARVPRAHTAPPAGSRPQRRGARGRPHRRVRRAPARGALRARGRSRRGRRRGRQPLLRRQHRRRGAALRRRRRRRRSPRDGGDATYLLPDACLTNGRFLDGIALDDRSTATCAPSRPTAPRCAASSRRSPRHR